MAQSEMAPKERHDFFHSDLPRNVKKANTACKFCNEEAVSPAKVTPELAVELIENIVAKTRGALEPKTQTILRDILVDCNSTYEILLERGFA